MMLMANSLMTPIQAQSLQLLSLLSEGKIDAGIAKQLLSIDVAYPEPAHDVAPFLLQSSNVMTVRPHAH